MLQVKPGCPCSADLPGKVGIQPGGKNQHEQKQKIPDSHKPLSVCLNEGVRPLPPRPRKDHTAPLVRHPPERGTTALPEAGDGRCDPDNGDGE